MPILLLVDGSSYLYRAFYALPDLTNSKGEPSGALTGVLNMMRRLDADFSGKDVAYKACIFDAKGKTFRDDLYAAYKANRAAMPENLRAQIEAIHEGVQALGWQTLSISGVEADDVIGTLASEAAQNGFDVVISTGDKDFAQLVSPRISLVNTMSNEHLDEAGVLAKFGVKAAQMIDYLALMGDTSDNVPGVPKVGPKTAVKWLTEYENLDNLVANADKIKGVVGENLRGALDFLPIGKNLVTIRCDVELPQKFNELLPKPKNKEVLSALFTRYEMRSWLKEITQEIAKEQEKNKAFSLEMSPKEEIKKTETSHKPAVLLANRLETQNYATIFSFDELNNWLGKINAAKLVALDLETTSLNPLTAQIVGISFAVAKGCAAYIPLSHDYIGAPKQLDLAQVLAILKPWLESKTQHKIGQNLKYDAHVLANYDIKLNGVLHDTLLQSYVLESGNEGARNHDLGTLALRHLGVETVSYETLCGKGKSEISFSQVDIEKAAFYGAEDADLCLYLHDVLYPQIAANEGLQYVYERIEMPTREVLFAMERNGMLIDSAQLEVQSHFLGERLQALETEAFSLANQPFNMNSPKQLAEILFVKMQLPVKKKTPSGVPSTDEEVLSELALDFPLPKLLLESRQLAKLKSTYTDKLPKMVNAKTGRIHTNYAQAVAITGRLTSNEPNLQNIPVRTKEGRKIRAAFVAPENASIISADYSQIELRIMAHLSDDARLLEAFKHGEDVHKATAAEIFGVSLGEVDNDQRRIAKTINFGLIYGMSAHGLAKQLGLTRTAAQSYIDRYFARYTGVLRYMEETRNNAKLHGFVETVCGRRLWLPELKSTQAMRRNGAERAAINAPMQGTAADIIKLAMIAVQNYLIAESLKSKLVLQVHDELVLEVPDVELEKIKENLPKLMSGVIALKVPLLAEIGVGKNWDEAH